MLSRGNKRGREYLFERVWAVQESTPVALSILCALLGCCAISAHAMRLDSDVTTQELPETQIPAPVSFRSISPRATPLDYPTHNSPPLDIPPLPRSYTLLDSLAQLGCRSGSLGNGRCNDGTLP